MERTDPSGLAENLSSTTSNGSQVQDVPSLHTLSMHLGSPLPSTSPWHLWALVSLVLMLALTSVALLANAAVLAVVVRAAHLRQRLVFVGHLCTVDLLCATLLMPAGMVNTSPLLSGASALFASSPSPLACRLYAGLHTTLVAASIFTVTAISVERYYYIVHPMRYEATMTPRLAAAILALLWVVSVLLGSATTLGWPTGATVKLKVRSSSCCSLWWSHGGRYCWGFALLFASVCFCLPAVVILAVYGNVYKVARVAARHQHGPVPSWTCKPAAVVGLPKCRSNSINSQTTIITTVTSRWHGCAVPHRRRSPGGGKAAVTLAVIVGQFLLCWLPYFSFHLRLSLAPSHSGPGASGANAIAPITWLAYSSFTANPFFYGLLNRQIREELAKLLCCCRRQHAAVVRPLRTEMAAPEGVVHNDFLHFLQRDSNEEGTPYMCKSFTSKSTLDQSCVKIPGLIPEELA